MSMKKHIGVKMILAVAMNRGDYNAYRVWKLPDDEDGSDDGFLVEYIDGGQANHPNHKGYISWSPKGVFDNSYRPVDGMSFGMATEAAKILGLKVERLGWNGKGMFVYFVPENVYPAVTDVAKAEFGGNVPYGAYFAMKTAQGNVVPWLASQTDMAADDWRIVD